MQFFGHVDTVTHIVLFEITVTQYRINGVMMLNIDTSSQLKSIFNDGLRENLANVFSIMCLYGKKGMHFSSLRPKQSEIKCWGWNLP